MMSEPEVGGMRQEDYSKDWASVRDVHGNGIPDGNGTTNLQSHGSGNGTM